jgi:peroxiredoxin
MENKVIPSILVRDFHDNQVDLLDEFNGTNLLLIIYNNQCLGCTGRAIPLAYELQKEFSNIQVVGIHTNFNSSLVTEKDIKSIFTIPDLPFPIYIDPDHTVYDQFESSGTPQWILITKDGILSRSIFGSQDGAKNRLLYSLEQLNS